MAVSQAGHENNSEMVNQLIKEQQSLDPQCTYAYKLLQQEIERLRSTDPSANEAQRRDNHIEIHAGKQFRLKVKVHIPVDEHPNFNFVGKLLGPKGSSLQQLQEATQTRMAILGRGSMRDKKKEEELRNQGDPKYTHLHEDLHVEVTAYAPPSEAYRRMSSAIGEIQRFLIPDYYDDGRQFMGPMDGKPKPPYGAPMMPPRAGPPAPPPSRPMPPPMAASRESPRRPPPPLAQSTYASPEDEWGTPRTGARRGAFHGNAAPPRAAARPAYEEPVDEYNNYGDNYGDYNSGNSSYYDYSADTDGAYGANDYAVEERGPVRGATPARGRNNARQMSHPYGGATRRGY